MGKPCLVDGTQTPSHLVHGSTGRDAEINHSMVIDPCHIDIAIIVDEQLYLSPLNIASCSQKHRAPAKSHTLELFLV